MTISPDHMFWLQRADGEGVGDDYAGFVVSSLDDTEPVDEEAEYHWADVWPDTDPTSRRTEYVVTEYVKVVERRHLLPSDDFIAARTDEDEAVR